MRKSFERIFLAILLLQPVYGAAQARPIQLSMTLPRAKGAASLLNAGNYTIALQLRAGDAAAFVDDISFDVFLLDAAGE